MSRQVENMCKNLKDANVSVQNKLDIVKIFDKSVEAVRQKDLPSTLMGLGTVMKAQHLGLSTIRLLHQRKETACLDGEK
jgi:hypothetical protein